MAYIENSEQTTNSYNEYVYTPYPRLYEPGPYGPSLTLSQRLELNKILHTGAITNNNVSTFSDQDIYEPEQLTTNEEQKQNHGCCVIC